MDHRTYYHAFLGTNSLRGSEGIYHIAIRKSDLSIHCLHTCQALNGDYVWIAPDGRTLYCIYEVIYYNGQPSAAAAAYRIGEEGELSLLNVRNVHGQMACFCSTDRDGRFLLTSSYMSGSVTVTPIRADGSLGEEQQVIQQPVRNGFHWPSVHSVYETPDRRFLFSTNVGLDRVLLHRRTEEGWVQAYEHPIPGRPRQAAFSADGRFAYVSTEFGGEVFVLAYHPEQQEPLTTVQRISTTHPGWSGHAETAGIKLSPDGRMLVVTNRTTLNNLAVFAVDPASGMLARTGTVEVNGFFPRDLDFTPDSRYLLVGLQFSDNLELFEADTAQGTLKSVRADARIPGCSGIRFFPAGEVET